MKNSQKMANFLNIYVHFSLVTLSKIQTKQTCQKFLLRVIFFLVKLKTFEEKIINMTKLMEWLTGLLAIFALWLSILFGSDLANTHPNLTLFWPILFLVIPFGLFSVAVIIFRVYNFNDCREAAEELQGEIKAAKEDLKKKGMVF